MSFADKVKQAVDSAPAAGFVNTNFGRLETKLNVLKWTGSKGERKVERFPFTEDYELKKGEDLEISFKVYISELNPNLEFDFERNVLIKTSSADGKFLTDWSETVLPSLVKVFGEDWISKVVTNKKAVYVAVETVDSLIKPKEGKKNYGTVRFVKQFPSLDACKSARDEMYGQPGEEVEDDGELGIPSAVIEQAKALYTSLGKNDKQFKSMMKSSEPFNQYDADALLEEVKGE